MHKIPNAEIKSRLGHDNHSQRPQKKIQAQKTNYQSSRSVSNGVHVLILLKTIVSKLLHTPKIVRSKKYFGNLVDAKITSVYLTVLK